MIAFAYRLPNESEIFRYEAENFSNLNFIPRSEGFLFAPFFFDGSFRFIPALRRVDSISGELTNHNIWKEEDLSLQQATEYKNLVLDIKKLINGKREYKIVASRRKLINRNFNFDRLFENLCKIYPEDYVFLISTPEWGTWIGVSPELLLKKSGNLLSTNSLAGTRPADTELPWDVKNIQEQQIVTDYLVDIFRSYGMMPYVSDTQTKKAGKIEHLKTDIMAESTLESESELILDLYPTPALSGYPKNIAKEWIRRHEKDNRGLYGGFSGPVSKNGDFSFYVTLRCLASVKDGALLFAGGGITSLSDPEEEWLETERKLTTLLSQIN